MEKNEYKYFPFPYSSETDNDYIKIIDETIKIQNQNDESFKIK